MCTFGRATVCMGAENREFSPLSVLNTLLLRTAEVPTVVEKPTFAMLPTSPNAQKFHSYLFTNNLVALAGSAASCWA